jgi:large subunit ribosomal protein L17
MRHKNNVKQLNKSHAHRKAMFGNMLTSFFLHERIVTTKQKGKELKKLSEKMITRAKRNLKIDDKEIGKKLHNKREVMKTIKDRDIVNKLFEKIAPRFLNRNGGFTRLYLLGRRAGDSAEMAIVELVERESKSVKTEKPADEGKEKKKSKFGFKGKDKDKGKDKK